MCMLSDICGEPLNQYEAHLASPIHYQAEEYLILVNNATGLELDSRSADAVKSLQELIKDTIPMPKVY